MKQVVSKNPGRLDRWLHPLAMGVVATLVVLLADTLGMLAGLENWMYDRRARYCQFHNIPASADFVHLDIDEPSMERIGRWPWKRSELGRVIEEIAGCGARLIVLDIVFAKTQTPQEDRALGESIAAAGNVVTPVDFTFEADTPLRRAVTQAVEASPGIGVEALRGQLAGQFAHPADRADIPRQRELARRSNVLRRLLDLYRQDRAQAGLMSDSQCARRLFAAPAAADELLVAELRPRIEAGLRLDAFGRTPVPGPQPLRAIDELPPVAPVFRAARAAGSVFNPPSGDGIVRSVPMVVECRGRWYPQLGLAVACSFTGARFDQAQINEQRIILTTPQGKTITIPVHREELGPPHGTVGLFADVAWFGPPDWTAMYDAYDKPEARRHIPITMAWDLYKGRQDLVGKDDKSGRSKLDDAKVALKYIRDWLNENQPTPPIAASRPAELVAPIQEVLGRLQTLRGAGEEIFPQIDSAAEFLRRFKAAQERFEQSRDELRKRVEGRIVLVGSTSLDLGDMVTTSIHAKCPGVVIHGLVTNSILTGNFWTRTPAWVGSLLTLAMGLLMAMLASRAGPLLTAIILALLALGYAAINGLLLFDYFRLAVNVAGPLVAMAAAWSACVASRLVREAHERIRIGQEAAAYRHEMDLAKAVQEALIPKVMPAFEGFEVLGWTQPASTCGGDCFDLWFLPDGRLAILLGDASGHGLASAMVIAQVRTLIRMLTESDARITPHAVLDRINRRVAADTQSERFATVFLAFLNTDGQIEWASAGHGPMLFGKDAAAPLETLVSTGLPTGLLEDDWAATAEPPPPPLQLEPGGAFLITSDGIFESPDPKGELFGVEQMQAIFESLRTGPCEPIITALRQALAKWHPSEELTDDHTIVVLRRLPVSA